MCCKFLSRNHRIVCSDKSARSSYESGEIICRLVVEQRGLHHTDALKDALPSIPPLKRIAEKGPRMMELVMIMMELVIYLLGKSGATKSDEFSEKFQRGAGVIFNQKADFGNFKQGFLSMKLVQKSKFRV